MITPKIFTRAQMKADVESTHAAIVESQIAYMLKVKAEGCLLDFMVSPVSRTLGISSTQHENIKNALVNDTTPEFSRFGVYDMTEISVMKSRFEFVDRATRYGMSGILMNPTPKHQAISDISLLTDSPTTLLAIKYFALCKGAEFEYVGLPAMTAPARSASSLLFGTSMTSPSKAKTMHTQIAMETGLSELQVNTVLWLIGDKINK